jgi:hypothetical protein
VRVGITTVGARIDRDLEEDFVEWDKQRKLSLSL